MSARHSQKTVKPDKKRRSILAGAIGASLVSMAPGMRLIELTRAKSDDEAVTAKTRWGMLIDTDKCAVDCDACVTGCNDEHGLTGAGRPQTDAQWIRKITLTDNQTSQVTSLPMLCQHCENPPCVDVCPTGASFKREDGIVLVDKHICIGCRYCIMACPYKARSFVHETLTEQKPWSPRGKGTVEGCTLCVHRVDKDRTPACVEACNSDGKGAMVFGDLNDPNSDIATSMKSAASRQVRADLGLNPGVRYQNL
jgi:molybdopterin-containing oxidoreductase family iron-sulfur binding subunit